VDNFASTVAFVDNSFSGRFAQVGQQSQPRWTGQTQPATRGPPKATASSRRAPPGV